MRIATWILCLVGSCTALPIAACGPTPPAGVGGAGGSGGSAGSTAGMRDVLLVGNSVSGTVSFIDPQSLRNLGSVNVIPDFDEVMSLIQADPIRKAAYPLVQRAQLLHYFEPQNGDRFVDDVFVSPDGATLYVSRSNLGDVAAFDLSRPGHPRKWRSFVSSVKADHATISPDGTRLVVSATGTARVADVFDARTGARVGAFPTGTFPHQNDYSADGRYIYNSSIGNVSYQAVRYADNHLVGDRWLVKVDANTLSVVRTWVFEWGIRPNLIPADEKILYTQLSYLNGVVKYDMQTEREIARSDQPLSEFALNTYATYDEYPHHSAHHGLAMSLDGKLLCDCGTIDNDVAIVSTADMQVQARIPVGILPYWAVTSPDGRYCFVTVSGSNEISVIEYATRQHVKALPVGRLPQRSRMGRVPEAILGSLNASAG